MDKNTLQYIAIALAGLTIVILVMGYFLGWFQKGKLKLVDGDGAVDRLPSGAIDETRYYSIANSVKNSLTGVNYQAIYFINAADQLLSLNNNELRVVSNIYARDMATGEYKTLRSIISGEFVGSSAFGLVPTPCSQQEYADVNSACYKKKKVLERLNNINA